MLKDLLINWENWRWNYLSTDKQTYKTSSVIVSAALGSPGPHFVMMTHTQTHKAKTNTSPAVAAGLYKSSKSLNFFFKCCFPPTHLSHIQVWRHFFFVLIRYIPEEIKNWIQTQHQQQSQSSVLVRTKVHTIPRKPLRHEWKTTDLLDIKLYQESRSFTFPSFMFKFETCSPAVRNSLLWPPCSDLLYTDTPNMSVHRHA